MRKFFITGTDTNVGKTYVTEMLLESFNQQGKKTLGLKPIASGAQAKAGRLYNDDAMTLMNASSVKHITYKQINPFVFEDPIAPHIAAYRQGEELSVKKVKTAIQKTLDTFNADIYLIEGVGGWAVPLNINELMSDLVKSLGFPVILVVGIKLGCLNHAIVTAKTILQSNVPLVGWIANCMAPEALVIEENIKTLTQWIKAPLLGTIPYGVRHCQSLRLDSLCKEISPAENATT
jgi:dethiobiotin synthetase